MDTHIVMEKPRPRLATRLTDLFGIQRPILCGGLMWLATAEYVAAVVNAGAMGFITPRSYPDIDAFRDAVQRCRQMTGGKPFGVNLYISARPGENEKMKLFLDVLIEEGVRHVETAGYSPEALLPRLREAGCVVVHKVTTLRHAQKAAAAGVDAVVMIGSECGGHPGMGDIPAMLLAARALEALDIPVVVGGGIGSGRQIAAALALGADGVLIGSRMLVADEIWAHRAMKEYLVGLDETCTTTVLRSLKNTYRCLANETAAEVARLEAAGQSDYATLGPLVGGALQKEAYESGDWTKGVLSLGPAAAWCDRLEPAAAILDRLEADALAQLDAVARKRG
ncbi:NAD(P)H-dependent flavin oxidoreductase [Oceanibaculum pacificum]|nr:nitronate monooxygenase [Oceanibaculum pacificum]